MAAAKKTNALRMLDAQGISYMSLEYELSDGFTSGSDIARMQGLDPDSVFKTLVTESNTERSLCLCYSCRLRAGSEKGSEALRCKKDGNAADEKAAASDRLYSWRLFANRNEKTVFYSD